MFIPIGDQPNPRGFPLVNWLLIAANVAVYVFVSWPLANRAADPNDPATLEYLRILYRTVGGAPEALLSQISAYDVFIYVHGYRPAAPSVETLFGSLFLHAGLLHLAGNMLFLWIFGDNVEHRLGKIGYVLAYLATGVCATWTYALFSQEPWMPVVGASGAISGVLGFYFLWFPRNVVKVFVALFPFFVDVVLLPARWVLGFYLLVDNLLPFLLQSASGGVAYGAHVGGFVGGVVLAALFGRPTRPQLVPDQAPGGESLPDTAGLSPSDAAVALRRYIARNPSGAGLAEAHLKLGLLHLQHGQPTTAYQYLLSALELDPSPEVERQARAALSAIDELQRQRRRLI
jgi:rhomboid family protein